MGIEFVAFLHGYITCVSRQFVIYMDRFTDDTFYTIEFFSNASLNTPDTVRPIRIPIFQYKIGEKILFRALTYKIWEKLHHTHIPFKVVEMTVFQISFLLNGNGKYWSKQ